MKAEILKQKFYVDKEPFYPKVIGNIPFDYWGYSQAMLQMIRTKVKTIQDCFAILYANFEEYYSNIDFIYSTDDTLLVNFYTNPAETFLFEMQYNPAQRIVGFTIGYRKDNKSYADEELISF